MAMEQQMDERHYEDLAIIQEHQKNLEHSKLTGEEYSTPPAVQAVVYDVSNQMFKQINGFASDLRKKYLSKTDSPKKWGFGEMKAYVTSLPRPGDTKNPFRSGKAKAMLRNVRDELRNRIAELEAESNPTPVQRTHLSEYDRFMQTVVFAINKFDSSGK
jgi:hypothetical protein